MLLAFYGSPHTDQLGSASHLSLPKLQVMGSVKIDKKPMPATDPRDAQIRKLEERIAALEDANGQLMASAKAFADLADRLNQQLLKVRIRHPERDLKSQPLGFGRAR